MPFYGNVSRTQGREERGYTGIKEETQDMICDIGQKKGGSKVGHNEERMRGFKEGKTKGKQRVKRKGGMVVRFKEKMEEKKQGGNDVQKGTW